MIVWGKHSEWHHKRKAQQIVKEMTAPGPYRVRARVRKIVTWRVEIGQDFAREAGGGNVG